MRNYIPKKVDVELAFDGFIREHGGEVVADIIERSPRFLNADYLFRYHEIVIELKRLVENKLEDRNIQAKIQHKFYGWIHDGTIPPFYGRCSIESKSLPEHCQRELLDVYATPMRRRIIKANKQIKATLEHFDFKKGKGILILVNDGNYALEPNVVMYLLARILGTNFHAINSVVYCTINLFSESFFSENPSLFWAHATRPSPESVSMDFTTNLFRGWQRYLERFRGEPIEEILLTDPSHAENMHFLQRKI